METSLLAGALALLATRLAALDVNGACYTFCAPRVRNHEYFRSVKAPAYRIVNSGDIVPRVPRALPLALVLVVQATAWLTSLAP